MISEKDVYLAILNVPSQFLYSKKYNIFVELRAELVHWEANEPKYIASLNNLNMLVASNIKWDGFSEFLDELISGQFKIRFGNW